MAGKKRVLLDRLRKTIEEDVDGSAFDSADDMNPADDDEEVYNPVAARQRDQRQHNPLPPEHGERRRLRQRNPPPPKQIGPRVRTQETECENDETRVWATHRRDMSGEREIAQVTRMADTFTIKDVEGSIPVFTGEDRITIHRWIEEFEDTSILLR